MHDDTEWPRSLAVTRLDQIPHTTEVAFISNGDVWSLSRLAVLVERLAAGLLAFGIKRGDRLALHLRNGPELAAAYLACFRIGAVAAPINLRFKQAELEIVLQHLQPRIYIGQSDTYAHVNEIEPFILPLENRFLVDRAVGHATDWAVLASEPGSSFKTEDADATAPALLLMTSGTSGLPKFVAHSLSTLTEAIDRIRHTGLQPGQRFAFCVPMVHVSGAFFFFASLRLGAEVVMCDAVPGKILDAIQTYGCSYTGTLPALTTLLMHEQWERPRDVSSLRVAVSSGDVPPVGQQEAFEVVFGCPLRTFWASTEALGSFTYASRFGPMSRLVPGTEMKLVGGDGAEVSPGQPGEMLLRGPHVMLGYWEPPCVLTGLEDGWYHSGDIMMTEPDGNVRFVSRAKDLIVRGGSNISPVEVEQVIASHELVEEAGVAGLPDPLYGQRVMGLVHLKVDVDPTVLPDIVAWVSTRLADYKVPERLFTAAALPRSALGKMDRRQVAAMLEQAVADAGLRSM